MRCIRRKCPHAMRVGTPDDVFVIHEHREVVDRHPLVLRLQTRSECAGVRPVVVIDHLDRHIPGGAELDLNVVPTLVAAVAVLVARFHHKGGGHARNGIPQVIVAALDGARGRLGSPGGNHNDKFCIGANLFQFGTLVVDVARLTSAENLYNVLPRELGRVRAQVSPILHVRDRGLEPFPEIIDDVHHKFVSSRSKPVRISIAGFDEKTNLRVHLGAPVLEDSRAGEHAVLR
mmetsp:Transcript_25649/g.84449  ORF Transcript_25649/g.84449 Transcript_25649/m.84449 type:complete len:232 (-) Transcript_25649:1282-1977(-)